MTDKRQYAVVVVRAGAEFIGIQQLPQGNLILFTDAQYRSTLAVPECEFSPEAVSLRLRENRRRFTNPSGPFTRAAMGQPGCKSQRDA